MLPIAPNSLVGHHEDHEVVEIVAIDLENKTSHSLATFGPSAEVNSKFLLNETHRSIFLKKSQTRCHLHAVNENMIAIASDQSSYITMNFSLHPNEIAELEAEPLYQKQMEKEEALKAKEAVKAQKSKVAKKYLEDPSLTVQGWSEFFENNERLFAQFCFTLRLNQSVERIVRFHERQR